MSGFVIGLVIAIVLLIIYNQSRNVTHAGGGTSSESRAQKLVQLTTDMQEFFKASAHPTDLLDHPQFKEGVDLLIDTDTSSSELFEYARGDNAIVACMSLVALGRKDDALEFFGRLIDSLESGYPAARYLTVKILADITPPDKSLVGPILVKVDFNWGGEQIIALLNEIVAQRTEAGEKFSFGDTLQGLDQDDVESLNNRLELLGREKVSGLIQELNDWRASKVDILHLNTIGRIWNSIDCAFDVIEHRALQKNCGLLEASLTRTSARSMLVVGENGVGKTSSIRSLAKNLLEQGWHFFEAGHTDLIAGQSYIGQIEGRIRELMQHISGNRRIIWYIPEFQMLAFTGRTINSPIGVLDILLPYIDSGQITVIGEITPADLEQLYQMHPRCESAFETLRVESPPPAESRDLAAEWVRINSPDETAPILASAVLDEAWLLAGQFLEDRAAPGNILDLLKLTQQRLITASDSSSVRITLDDLIQTMSQLTGLPENLLDERRELDLDALRSLFEKRVMGQPEAVDCLIERLAMIKAGINDATRPLGVFLFAGPTGTGKTEIAKVMTEYLFGSAARMIRLDMSEVQSQDGLVRLIGDQNETHTKGNALVDKIRKQPFSVVLLDEFEKAHPRVWDLFLQVFDDGRLTSQRGFTADCRHALFILTSNLGAAIPTGVQLGFGGDAAPFDPDEVRRVVAKTFQKEFLNRLDRIVVFRPLNRENVREILHKELEEAFQRRGLRNRGWAVVWDDAALEFLLDKGFTVDLGARPLKRAIERHLLTPLAMTIVNHNFPEGDQFLYVKVNGDKLEVEFIDPDLPDEEPPLVEDTAAPREGEASDLTPCSILLDTRGTPDEVSALAEQYDRLRKAPDENDWKETKQSALDLINQADFWSSPDRFAILGEVEYRDRIESGIRTAGALLERLVRNTSRPREHVPRKLVERLARQVYLLDAACESLRRDAPSDAFILVEAAQDSASALPMNNDFAQRLAAMYRGWAEKRRMKMKLIEERVAGGNRPYRFLAAVSGFAAYSLLQQEAGLHVLEVGAEHRQIRRAKVLVRVEPQPEEPVGNVGKEWKRQADTVLSANRNDILSIVRRYNEEPSPLVRDMVNNWRTGRLDRVLAGDFDLFRG